MKNFKIIPLDADYAERIRNSRKDDFGHEVVEQPATGYGPCRVSLEPFIPGEDVRLLFSHGPFEIDNAFDQRGPVFINKKTVAPYRNVYQLPPAIKNDKIKFPLTLIGYSRSQRMVFTKLVGDNDVDELIEKIFDEQPKVAYLHARAAE